MVMKIIMWLTNQWKPSHHSSVRIMSRTVACRQSFCYLRLPDRQYQLQPHILSFFSCRVDSLLHSQGSAEGNNVAVKVRVETAAADS